MNTSASNFFLMRHGETDTNRNHIWQGSQDIPLNKTGREQAREASLIVREIDPHFVITSNLSRAVETGKIAAQYAKNARFIINPELRERACGAVEGLTTSEILDKYGISMTMTSTELDKVPGAEPYDQFARRVMWALNDIYEKYAGKRVLIVSHGGVLRSFYNNAIGILQPNGMHFRNCAIISLRMSNGRWELLDKHNTMNI